MGGCITGSQLQKVTASIRGPCSPRRPNTNRSGSTCCAFKPLPSSRAKVCNSKQKHNHAVLNYRVIAPSCVFSKMHVTGYLRSACFPKCAVCCIRAAFEHVSCTCAHFCMCDQCAAALDLSHVLCGTAKHARVRQLSTQCVLYSTMTSP